MTTPFAANGFGDQTQVNAGQQQQVPAQQQQFQPQQQQLQVQQGTPGQQQQMQQPGQQPQTDEFGHRIRSALTSAEQTWRQQNATALQLEQAIRSLGHDPAQVIQRIQQQQAQIQQEAQRAQGITPEMSQQFQALQQQLEGVQRIVGEQRLAEAERGLTEFARQFGVDYSNPQVRDEIRQYALANNINLDTAFRNLYFDRILQVNAQQAQGQQLAALQGRGPAPISTATPGSTQQQPVNYLNMSDKDFAEAEQRMRSQYYQR